jgi:hypothetical protein
MGSGGMVPQRTGFPGQQQQQQQQQPQPSGNRFGVAGGAGNLPSGGNYSFLSAPPPSSQFNPSGLSAQPTGFPGGGMRPQPTGFSSGLQPQATGFPAAGGMGMRPQQTGYGGMGLQPQPTGMPHDPRLQMMAASFMPGNMSSVRDVIHIPDYAS